MCIPGCGIKGSLWNFSLFSRSKITINDLKLLQFSQITAPTATQTRRVRAVNFSAASKHRHLLRCSAPYDLLVGSIATDVAPRCGYKRCRRDAAIDVDATMRLWMLYRLRWAGSNIADSLGGAGTNAIDKSTDHAFFTSCPASGVAPPFRAGD